MRDLHFNPYLEYFRTHTVHCGWMIVDWEKGEAIVEDHGTPGRIAADDIDEMLNLYGRNSLEQFMLNGAALQAERNRTAKYKYTQIIRDRNLHGRFVHLPQNNRVDTRSMVKPSPSGMPGTVVLTGQPGRRKPGEGHRKASGKYFEFVFWDELKGTYLLDTREENGLFSDFCFIYQDSEDWKYWKRQDRIPVFFTLENGKIQYLGLSYLFKLPFKKHLKEYLSQQHLTSQFDLADCIFGAIGTESLKGRVQFSNAFCLNPRVGEERAPYMGSPKPTYYPMYTQQVAGSEGRIYQRNPREGVKYKTFLDGDAKLRGWKRYPVRQQTAAIPPAAEGQGQNTSPFRPLEAGCEFCCVVRYHNLREEELAALVYALHVGDNCLYSLGFCKPYGYGVVELSIEGMEKTEIDRLRLVFEKMMESKIRGYQNTPQLNELRAMMTIARPSEPLTYLPDPKAFASLKKIEEDRARRIYYGEYQRNYSELIGWTQGASPSSGGANRVAPSTTSRPTKAPQKEVLQEAVVSFCDKGLVKAKLPNGQSFPVDMNGRTDRLRIGFRIKVKVIRKGGTTCLLFQSRC